MRRQPLRQRFRPLLHGRARHLVESAVRKYLACASFSKIYLTFSVLLVRIPSEMNLMSSARPRRLFVAPTAASSFSHIRAHLLKGFQACCVILPVWKEYKAGLRREKSALMPLLGEYPEIFIDKVKYRWYGRIRTGNGERFKRSPGRMECGQFFLFQVE